MSSTIKGSARIEHDNYPTPQEPIEAFLKQLDLSNVKSFCEPCRGDSAILKHFVGIDNVDYAEIREGIDYLKKDFEADLIVTNPPFSLALEFLEKSLKEAKTVAYLLRLNFLGSQKRKPFWQQNPPTHQFTLAERPSFVDVCQGDKKKGIKRCGAVYHKDDHVKVCVCGGKVSAGVDSTEYAWFVWDRMGIIKTDNPINVI